jgi:hypothetical protein
MAHSTLKNTKKKLIANQFSRSKVIDYVRELLTRSWNARHSERHCIFTAGDERVKNNVLLSFFEGIWG